MAKEEETTTWPEVCKHVGMSDNLFPTCRKKVPGFFQQPMDFSSFDEIPGQDFDELLLSKALPVPSPPKARLKKEISGEDLMAPPPNTDEITAKKKGFFDHFTLEKVLVYGGLAAAVLLLLNKKGLLLSSETGSPSAATSQPASKRVQSTKAA